jgi:hypothetical protein
VKPLSFRVKVSNYLKDEMNMKHMKMPAYFGLVKFLAQLGALFGVIVGVVSFMAGLQVYELLGLAILLPGVYIIMGSLASLGVAYCFLSFVQASIETRNAVASYIYTSSPEAYKLFTSFSIEEQEHTRTPVSDWNQKP